MKNLIEQRAARLGSNSALSTMSDEALSPTQHNTLTPSNTARREYVQVSPLECPSSVDESFRTVMSSLTEASFSVYDKVGVPDLPKKALWMDEVPKEQNPKVKESVLSRRGIARLNCFVKPSHRSTPTTLDPEKERLLIAMRTVTPTNQRAPSVEDYAPFRIVGDSERLDI
jgi:hypothetical protein